MLPVLSSTLSYPPKRNITLMTMPWTSYLVYQHKDILDQDDRMELFERYEVIMDGFIAPQVKLMADLRSTMALFNRTMKSFAPAAREMAIRDQEHQAPCEKPVMMWNHVTHLAREMLSEHPSKQGIEQLRHRCADLYDVRFTRFPRFSSIDRDAQREINTTVFTLDTVLQQWDLTKAFPLRFYPSKPAHFDTYEIEDPRPSFIR